MKRVIMSFDDKTEDGPHCSFFDL